MELRAAAKGEPLATCEALIAQLSAIRDDMIRAAEGSADLLAGLHPRHRASGRNLLHYLAFRRHDLRPLQEALSRLGLSSLGRAEAHVLASVDAVLGGLHRIAGRPVPPEAPTASDFEEGPRRLRANAEALFGPPRPERGTRIMVTLPGDAAADCTLVYDLLRAGTDCVRVNCAHDDPAAWGRMIGHLRRAEEATGRPCRLLMDLAGPKLRTGPVTPGPAVVRVRPERDALGRVVRPARVWLTGAEAPGRPFTPADATVPVPDAWLAALAVGDRIRFTDARGAKRTWRVVDAAPDGCWAEAQKTAYVVPGTRLRRSPGRGDGEKKRAAAVGALPAREGAVPLGRGDLLVLTASEEPGRPATADARGALLRPATVGCTLPAALAAVRPGERVLFDDGRIGGVAERVEGGRVLVRVTHAGERAKLRADQGINLPDTALRLPALTADDLRDLPFVAERADLVALSFASGADDVRQLRERLAPLGERAPALVVKVETKRGFEALPAMLLEAMRGPRCGVMIARGDLAVECGFERLAEVQEEVLWVCEAAHVPVVWATQVLESLAKGGLPSRAEVTDAAVGHRAECVMLNKGPHVVEAVQALDDILRRMQAHQRKKSARLRALHLASGGAGERAGA
ncbi:MAG TPA: pyruvate kinase [Rubricoccaceae bacterium]|nr:pyruvate kinase [Rubricoccaceae bacterium]